jgi:23S rRNA (cytosine1962-C5)-methyltransferase
MDTFSTFSLLQTPKWDDYELLDTGNGLKLERFGPYTFVRPEVQAMWNQALSVKDWDKADGRFQPSNEESGGHWSFKKKIEERWEMRYRLTADPLTGQTNGTGGNDGQQIRFWAMTTPGRHLGVFPETASHWEFITEVLNKRNVQPGQNDKGSMKVLNLFGYTGLASLTAALAGAQVTHVDASKKSINWARENQVLSKLENRPIRWIVDDAVKFVEREGRRGSKYDGIILDPPKFGRGPKGEVWEVYRSLPGLLAACRAILSEHPLFVIVTAYAIKTSAVHIGQALHSMIGGFNGKMDGGELVVRESSAGRHLSQAVYARWRSE